MKLYEDMLDILSEDGQNIDFFTESNIVPSFMLVSVFLADDISKYLDQLGIPYIRYNARKKAVAIFFIKNEDLEKTSDIERGVRIRASLPLLTTTDLKTAIYESNNLNFTKFGIYSLKHIPEGIAARMYILAGSDLTLGIDKENDGNYIISCHEKKKSILERLLLTAILEAHSDSDKYQENVKKSIDRLNNRVDYEHFFDELQRRENENVYIASASEPNNYMQISEGSATVYLNGKGTAAISARNSKELYSDEIKVLLSQIIKDPVLIPEKSLAEMMMTSYNPVVIKDYIPDKIVDHDSLVKASAIYQYTLTGFLETEKGFEKLGELLNENGIPDAEKVLDELAEIDAVTEPAKIAFSYITEKETGFDIGEVERIARGELTVNVSDKTETPTRYDDSEKVRPERSLDREKGGEI